MSLDRILPALPAPAHPGDSHQGPGGNAFRGRSFVQSLALLPKSVAFARRMRERGTWHIHSTWGHYPAACARVASRLLDLPSSFSAHAGLDVTADTTFHSPKVRAARFVPTCNEADRRVLAERGRARIVADFDREKNVGIVATLFRDSPGAKEPAEREGYRWPETFNLSEAPISICSDRTTMR